MVVDSFGHVESMVRDRLTVYTSALEGGVQEASGLAKAC